MRLNSVCRSSLLAVIFAALGAVGAAAPAAADVARSGVPTLTAIAAIDTGELSDESPTAGIDVVQNPNCNGDAVLDDPEPFHDSLLALTVRNPTIRRIRFTEFSYQIREPSGLVRSPRYPLVGSGYVAPGKTPTTVYALFLRSKDTQKFHAGDAGTALSPTLGFRTVLVELRGRAASGKRYTLRGSTTLSFGDFNRCG